jgi:SPP1 gp7 family putative phage head morphogenesis protein
MSINEDDLDFKPNVNNLKNRVGVTRSYYNEMPKELRALAFYVSDLEKMRQIESIRSSLENAIDKGLSFKDWKETLKRDVYSKLTDARQELVFRTNLNSAYNQSTRLEAFENQDATPYLRYSAINDDRVRPSHLELDGVTLPVDDEFWDYNTAPLGYNCRCAVIAVDGNSKTTTKKEITAIKSSLGIRSNAKSFGDEGFTDRQRIGNFSGIVKRNFESEINELPSRSPYKQKFKNSFESVKRKVDIWWNKEQNNFKGE